MEIDSTGLILAKDSAPVFPLGSERFCAPDSGSPGFKVSARSHDARHSIRSLTTLSLTQKTDATHPFWDGADWSWSVQANRLTRDPQSKIRRDPIRGLTFQAIRVAPPVR